MDNKKVLLGLTVLATPFVVENLVETNVASANQTAAVATQKQPVAATAQVAESKQAVATKTPAVAKSSEYVLNKPAKAYVTANDAAKRVNQKATYQAGTYYVYNQSQGMVNISKATGKAGSWINPVDNPNAKVATTTASTTKTSSQADQTTTTSQKPVTTNATTANTTTTKNGTNLSVVPPKSGQYTILKSTDAYVNAIDASKKVNAKGTVSAGNYYVFREYKGMLNVSRAQGKVGSWINPTDTVITDLNKTTAPTKPATPTIPVKPTTETKTTNTQTVGNKTNTGLFALTSQTEAYINAIDASKKVNARGRVAAGDYHIFREYKGMLNISKAKGKAGSWINPGVVTTTSTATAPTKPTTTQTVGNKTSAGLYAVTSVTDAYVNAADASKKTNARGKVSVGNYHIFREYKGMLNISKAKGKAGSWINPGVVTSTTTTTATAPTKPAQTETTSQTTTPTKPTTTQTVGNKTSAGLYAVTSVTEAYVNAADASKKTNAKGKVSVGNYHIFREYKGMLNISKAKGKAGSWINPGVVATTTTATATTPTKPTQTETTSQTTTQTKPTAETVGNKTSAGLFTLTKSTEAYITAADASKQVNARGKVSAGDYHIFREYKGMLNISKVKGKVGSWINPGEKDLISKLPETTSAGKDVSGEGVKYYAQDDVAWGNKTYGLGNLRHTGCVPTSLAMAISTLSKTVNPVTIADYLYKNTNTFNKKYQGTTSDGIPAVLKQYGLNYKVLTSKSGLQSELSKGNLVLSLVQGAKFITPGYTHAVIAKGLDKLGQTTVYNPIKKYGKSKIAVDSLWAGQSTAPIDRTLGGTFISIFK